MYQDLTYRLAEIPFSKAGSHLRICGRAESGSDRLVIGTTRRIPYIDLATKQRPFDYYEIALLRGKKEVPYQPQAVPWKLTLTAEGGKAAIAFLDNETLFFETSAGLTLQLLPVHSVCTLQWRGSDQCCMVDYRGLCQQQVRAGRGTTLTVADSLTVAGETGPYRDTPRTLTFSGTRGISGALRLGLFGEIWNQPLPKMAAAEGTIRKEWERWEKQLPHVTEQYRPAARQAWHILWSAEAAVGGLYRRRPILMSKNWMNQVWSWDNCFNALVVANADPELALDQLRLFFDHQSPTGMLPEPLNDLTGRYGYVKPPIYGWTVLGLERRLGRQRLRQHARELYAPIARQTEWWYAYHDSNRNGLCEYLHGNDSGWDNASTFDQGYPTEGADLSAHLVMQMEGLALLAKLLGRTREATEWSARARRQLNRMLKKQVQNDRFFAPLNGQTKAQPVHCLLDYIPMVLGHRLPARIRQALVADLSPGGPYLTAFGLATEAPHSAKYKPNGYWRGPIWAPSTYLIFDGLVDAGEVELARTIATRFCDMCAQEPGMYENYDALTGKGLCCPGYTWTAAVFLLLAEWLATNGR